jgi:DNA-binding MarR family transcriptional regulator
VEDRRRFALYITESGKRMLESARKLIEQHEADLAAPLSAAERIELARLLKKIISR